MTSAVRFGPLSVETPYPNKGLLARIIWPVLCIRVFVVCMLLSITGVVFATHAHVSASSHCRLRYEGNQNDITEQNLQGFAKEAGWSLTHPESPYCNRCPQNDRFPVWMAPIDICLRFKLGESHPLCNSASDNLESSHLKVCATQEQIDQAWADGGCHSDVRDLDVENTTSPAIRPFLGYDGALFCKAGYQYSGDCADTNSPMRLHQFCGCAGPFLNNMAAGTWGCDDLFAITGVDIPGVVSIYCETGSTLVHWTKKYGGGPTDGFGCVHVAKPKCNDRLNYDCFQYNSRDALQYEMEINYFFPADTASYEKVACAGGNYERAKPLSTYRDNMFRYNTYHYCPPK